jgi:hypothetical protein
MLPASQLLAEHRTAIVAAAADGNIEAIVQYGSMHSSIQQQVVLSIGPVTALDLLPEQPLADYRPSSSSSSSNGVLQLAELAEALSASDNSRGSSSSTVGVSRVEDPLAALSAANPVAAPLIQVGELTFLSPFDASCRRQPQSASRDFDFLALLSNIHLSSIIYVMRSPCVVHAI